MRDKFVELLLEKNPNRTREELAEEVGVSVHIIRRCIERINKSKKEKEAGAKA